MNVSEVGGDRDVGLGEVVHAGGTPVDLHVDVAVHRAGDVEGDALAVGDADLLPGDVAEGPLHLVERHLRGRPPSSPGRPSGTRMSRSCTHMSKMRTSMNRA